MKPTLTGFGWLPQQQNPQKLLTVHIFLYPLYLITTELTIRSSHDLYCQFDRIYNCLGDNPTGTLVRDYFPLDLPVGNYSD